MAVQAVPGFDLQPSAEQVALASNYITNFDFLNQYLPDTYLTLSNGQSKEDYTRSIQQ